MGEGGSNQQLNVLGEPLEMCCNDPMTGFYRDGYCNTGPMDMGTHTVCARMTDTLLEFSARAGNDLSTPRPEYEFPGLKADDRWCLCARRWLEAEEAGYAPSLWLRRTNIKTLSIIPIERLKPYALDLN